MPPVAAPIALEAMATRYAEARVGEDWEPKIMKLSEDQASNSIVR